MYDDFALHAVDLLSQVVIVIHPEKPLPRVIQIMAKRHVSSLPVEDHNGTIFDRITGGGLVRWNEGFPERKASWFDVLDQDFDFAPVFIDALRAEH